jgi:phosphoglycerate dehydrogenase-like enzyme
MLNLPMANLLNKNSKIAVTSRSFSKNEELVSFLKSKFKHVKLNTQGLSLKGKSLIEFLEGMDGAIIGIEPMTHQVISKLPTLKLISKYGVGTNNLDMSAIKQNNIALSISPGSNSQSVAEYALYLILLSLRQNFNNLEEISRRVWSQKKGRDLYGKKIGILGFGNIGKKLTSILKAFNVEILVFDQIKIKLNKTQQSYITQVPLNKLLKESDIISIHLPLVEGTNNFLTKKEFALMKKDVVLVNTARGGIVKEGDLYQFLKNNSEAFGAFDVFKKEPIFNSKLFKLPNFFASSHRASLTNEGIFNMGMAAIDGLLKK